jgi:hypothetical protein
MWCVALRSIEVTFFGDQQTASLFIYFCKEQLGIACCAPQKTSIRSVLCDCDRPAQKRVAL